MSSTNNIGQAILIVASIWLYYTYHLELWIVVALCALALATWQYSGFTKERGQAFKKNVLLIDAKIEYYRAKSFHLRKETDAGENTK